MWSPARGASSFLRLRARMRAGVAALDASRDIANTVATTPAPLPPSPTPACPLSLTLNATARRTMKSRVLAVHRVLGVSTSALRRRRDSMLGLTSALPACRAHSSAVAAPTVTEEEASADTKTPGSSLPSDTSDSAGPPVDPALLAEIQVVLGRQSSRTWFLVSDLYADLPAAVRRRYVKPHKSMTHVLEKCAATLGISLSATGVYYAKGNMSATSAAQPKPAKTGTVENAASAPAQGGTPQSDDSEAHDPSALSLAENTNKPQAQAKQPLTSVPPVGFFYDVGLTEVPNPPRDFDVSRRHLNADLVTQSSAPGSVIDLSDFVPHIPPFFVPVSEVLKNMPGYTAEHLTVYLKLPALELVTIDGERYVRLHGAFNDIALDGCEAAEALYERYRPPVALVDAFVAAFAEVCDQWMPLPLLLQRVGPQVAGQLPYHGVTAILYFAQMQHRFAFAVRQVPRPASGPAGVADTADTSPPSPPLVTEAAVLLRKHGYSALESGSTPTPKSFVTMLQLISSDKSVDIEVLRRQIPPAIQAEMKDYYGGLEGFLAAHKPSFFVPPETPTIVMRTSFRRRQERAKMTLEEQLHIATQSRNKQRMRLLRRRIAFRDAPGHPLHEPENLAKELSKHLPRRGFVTCKTFLKRNVPEELLMFMPRKTRTFFNAYPQYFQQFEHVSPSNWCLARPDQPLPRGVIRQSFSPEDLLRLIAELLQSGPRPSSSLHLQLPCGAQEVLKRRYGGVYYFVVRYPQYFSVVLKSQNENKASSAVVHLLQVPSGDLSVAETVASQASPTNPHGPDDDDGADEDDHDDSDGLD